MDKITGMGWISGIIAWLVIMWYTTTQAACLESNSCGGDDLLLFAILGIGMLAPAGIVASLVSTVFGDEKE